MRYHLIPVRMVKIKRQEITGVDEGVDKKEPSGTVGGNADCAVTGENSVEVPQKIKNRITMLSTTG